MAALDVSCCQELRPLILKIARTGAWPAELPPVCRVSHSSAARVGRILFLPKTPPPNPFPANHLQKVLDMYFPLAVTYFLSLADLQSRLRQARKPAPDDSAGRSLFDNRASRRPQIPLLAEGTSL